jgi:hypothetical protein
MYEVHAEESGRFCNVCRVYIKYSPPRSHPGPCCALRRADPLRTVCELCGCGGCVWVTVCNLSGSRTYGRYAVRRPCGGAWGWGGARGFKKVVPRTPAAASARSSKVSNGCAMARPFGDRFLR